MNYTAAKSGGKEMMMKKSFHLTDMEPTIRQTLSEGGTFQFYPRGTSMQPMIRQGRDMVVLAPLPEDIKKYQAVLYKRENGSFVLHRIVKIDFDSYTMRGDNQFVDEPGIKREQMIAVVSQIVRDGRIIEAENGIYLWKVIFWVESVKLRYILRKVRGCLGRIKRKISFL